MQMKLLTSLYCRIYYCWAPVELHHNFTSPFFTRDTEDDGDSIRNHRRGEETIEW